MNSESAYFEETAYHKCLFISTCDPNLFKLETQSKNNAFSSEYAKIDQKISNNPTEVQL